MLQLNHELPFGFLLSDFFNLSALPWNPTTTPLGSVFTSPTKPDELVALYQKDIVKLLIERGAAPRSLSSGSVGSPPAGATATSSSLADRPGYYSDAGGPMGVLPSGARIGGQGGSFGQSGRGGGAFGGSDPSRQPNPFSVGGSDLDPLGGRPANFPGFPGSSGPSFGPMGGGGDGGGMFMGPGHPLFGGGAGGGRFGGQGGVGGSGGGVWGGDGWLPQGAVPPGARFDPIGPQVSCKQLLSLTNRTNH